MTMLEAALSYAVRSWPVFPCHGVAGGRCTCRKACESPAKHPRTVHGLEDGTTDPAIIRGWWGRWPDANIAIVTGAMSGLVVLDVDIGPEKRGDESLVELLTRYGPLPNTVEAITGSGGRHILFAHPGRKIKNAAGLAKYRGLDIRGDGGYIIASPSRHISGRRYEWEASSDPAHVNLAHLPPWLLALLVQPADVAPAAGTGVGAPIPTGQRESTLTSLAGTMRKRGMAEPGILAALRAENADRCQPPLLDEALCRIAHSVVRYAPAAPPSLIGIAEATGPTMIWAETSQEREILRQAGCPSVVALPDGAPRVDLAGYERAFRWYATHEIRLSQVEKHVMALTGTPAGQKATQELVRRLGAERCWEVRWRSDGESAHDVMASYDLETVRACIAAAIPSPVKGIVTIDALGPAIDRLYRDGIRKGVSPGWEHLAKHYTIRPGELTLVLGVPSHGKTSALSAMLMRVAEATGWTFAICSPEQLPLELYAARLLELLTGEPFDSGPTPRMSLETLQRAKLQLAHMVSFLLPEDHSPTVSHLLELAAVQIAREGVKGVVLDPWNMMDHTRPGRLTEVEYISQALAQIKRFARLRDVHIWLVVHPPKLERDGGLERIPTAYDANGGAQWRNHADNILCIWRNLAEPTSLLQVHVQKIRFREVGSLGMVELDYDKVTGRYSEPTGWHYTPTNGRRSASHGTD